MAAPVLARGRRSSLRRARGPRCCSLLAGTAPATRDARWCRRAAAARARRSARRAAGRASPTGTRRRLGGCRPARHPALRRPRADLAGARRERLADSPRALGLSAAPSASVRSRRWWRRLRGARLLTAARAGGAGLVAALLDDPRPRCARRRPSGPPTTRGPSVARAARRCSRRRAALPLRRQGLAAAARARAPSSRSRAYLAAGGGPGAPRPARGRGGSPTALSPRAPAAEPRGDRPARCARRGRRLLARDRRRRAATERARALLDDPTPACGPRRRTRSGGWRTGRPRAALARRARATRPGRSAAPPALALRGSGAAGRAAAAPRLQRSDRFARDMARQVLDLPDAAVRVMLASIDR